MLSNAERTSPETKILPIPDAASNGESILVSAEDNPFKEQD